MRSALCPFVLAFVALLVGGCGSNDEAIDEIPVQKGSIGCLEYEIKDHIVTITDCDPSIAGKLEIPTTIETRPVNGIAQHAFERCKLLTNITIPSSVTSIEVSAFRGCRSLTSITIPDSVTSIGRNAFEYCGSLTAVTVLGDAPTGGDGVFLEATPTIYRKPEARGWGDTWGGRPVKLISEKP